MQRMIFQVKDLHLVGQGSSLAKRPHELRAAVLSALLMLAVGFTAHAQVNTGSTGSDGPFDYSAISVTTNVVIDMHDHPAGIYNYTYVNIPANVTVTFIPNANNTAVVWLVQNNVIINGTVDVSGQRFSGTQGGLGGPGGWAGGNGQNGSLAATDGQGPGGGFWNGYTAGNYGSPTTGSLPISYGNSFLIPLLGGSGASGCSAGSSSTGQGGGGGGGAILIAAANSVQIGGWIKSLGGQGGGGVGSGGGIRVVASQINGNGTVDVASGGPFSGRVRFDAYNVGFTGNVNGTSSQGSQFIIIPTTGELPQLYVSSVGGIALSASPGGLLSVPDAIITAQQTNPIPVIVSCAGLPLGTPITVTIKPANGSAVMATGSNNSGTASSSSATISINIPTGGGLIYATASTN